MVARPLWYNFPNDPNTFNIDQQFMLGDSLLISPVLQPGVSEVSAYFPQGRWFSLRENFDYGNEMIGNGMANHQRPKYNHDPNSYRWGLNNSGPNARE